jgi:molecular chaperone GrpE
MADVEQDTTETPGAAGARADDAAEQARGGAAADGQGDAEQAPGRAAAGARAPGRAAAYARGDGGDEQDARQAAGAHEDGDAAAIEGDLHEIVKTAAERDQYLALAQRTQADFENYRKRVARDAAVAQERGVARLARELLPALDNLDRAIEAAQDGDPLLEGVRLVRSELAAALARVGIESYAPIGEPFDPTRHEAMAQQPVPGAAPGTVAEVYLNGYRMGETIVRPARVLVAA